jgi:hypothetical protein
MVEVSPQRIVIPEARLAFPDLFTARSVDGGPLMYGATFILAPTSPAKAKIEAEEERVAKEKWGERAPQILAMIRANNRGAIKPGILKAKFDGFEGNYFVSSNAKARPTVVDRNGSPLTEKDGRIYAGCYVLAHISLWAQDNQYGQRINAEVTGVQFVRDGDAFSGGAAPSSVEEFADLGAGDEPDAGSVMS